MTSERDSNVTLPEPVVIDRHLPTGVVIRGYTANQMRDYATAAVMAERERCARMVDHILREGGGTQGDAIREPPAEAGSEPGVTRHPLR